MKKIKKIAFTLSLLSVFTGSFSAGAANAAGWPVSDIDLLSYLSNSAAGGIVADNGGVISLGFVE